MRAHWVSFLVGLALVLGALAFHAYATAIPPKSSRPVANAEPVAGGTVALVFHGAPDPRYTPRLLDKLASRRLRATFFVVGTAVTEYPDLVRRMIAEGHEVGTGTFRHGPDGPFDPAFSRTALAAETGVHSGLSEPDPGTVDVAVRDPHEIVAATDVRRVVRLHVTSSTVGVVDLLADRFPGHRFVPLTEATGRPGAHAEAGFGTRITGHALAFAWRYGSVVAVLLGVLSGIVAVPALLRTVMQLGMAHTSRRLRREDAVVEIDYAPAVSVVVPAFNEAANIVATVRSIASSEHASDVEVVVVDDGSTDGTADLVEDLDLPGVRVHRQPNGGKPAALNAGIALHLDGESLKPLWTFPLQQVAYRQLTYLVVKSLFAALHGTPVRWQSVGRSGLAEVATR